MERKSGSFGVCSGLWLMLEALVNLGASLFHCSHLILYTFSEHGGD